MLSYPCLFFGLVDKIPVQGQTFDLRDMSIAEVRTTLGNLVLQQGRGIVIFWYFDSLKAPAQTTFLKLLEDSQLRILLHCADGKQVIPTIFSRTFVHRALPPKPITSKLVVESYEQVLDDLSLKRPCIALRDILQVSKEPGVLKILAIMNIKGYVSDRQKKVFLAPIAMRFIK